MYKKKITLNLFFADYTQIAVDDETKKMNSGRVFRGNYRLSSSMWRTTDEHELYRKESLERELP